MLRSILGMPFPENILYVLILAFCVFLSLSVHEMSHGLAAYAIGDRTAKNSGRLSLNPLHHLDPIGALCLFLFGFGWAKPVPINPWNFKHKKAGMVVTAVAGPLSNFILAFIAVFVYSLIPHIAVRDGILLNVLAVLRTICLYLVSTNVGLGLFNLIPVPPLDGSKVLNALLPQNIYFKIMQYERYGFIVLIILINMPFFNRLLNICGGAVISFFGNIVDLIL